MCFSPGRAESVLLNLIVVFKQTNTLRDVNFQNLCVHTNPSEVEHAYCFTLC